MEEKEKTETPESAYNLNHLTIIQIAELQRQAIFLSNRHRYHDSFNCWQSIRLLIENRFTSKEKSMLNKLELNFHNREKILVPEKLEGNYTQYRLKELYLKEKTRMIMRKKLNHYVRYLMQLQRKYGITLTDKEHKPKLS
jgi:hypothetical protein